MMELPILIAITCAVSFIIPKNEFKADSFSRDWYGYATNQLCHALLIGGVGVFLLAEMYWVATGIYPYRYNLFLAMVAGYTLFEYRQGFRGLDTLEDILFTVVYGAGGALFVFKADSTETGLVVADPRAALIPLTAIAIHLFFGVVARRGNHGMG